jgi:hypothetical protein
MFEKISHIGGLTTDKEILFSTPFNYFFPEAARSRLCLLPESNDTVAALRELGRVMADPGDTTAESLDSTIPAIYTYFGQFIDHYITARTDRDTDVSFLGRNEPIAPRNPDQVVASLRNGRRPQLDLDSVFAEGPALAGTGAGGTIAPYSQSQKLYDGQFKLVTFETGGRRDLARENDRSAIIPDERNDENLNISQLQFAFLKFYNRVHDEQPGSHPDKQKYIRARQLVRWAYQYVVVNDYLKTVCDPNVVDDILANGPRFISSTAGRGDTFMPLEFSTAAFRFGHSMIRPSYQPNSTQAPIEIMELLGFAAKDTFFDAGDKQLKQAFEVDWEFYVRGGAHVQFARKIDTRIAHGLSLLPLGDRATDPVLSHLARSNLLRAYNLSIPTGQAVCDAFGVNPLTADEILGGEAATISNVVANAYFHHRTPLWYYVLRESAVQQQGERLGEIGSRLVAETLIGLLKQDPNSYLNNQTDSAVKDKAIDVKSGAGGRIKELRDILEFAGVL